MKRKSRAALQKCGNLRLDEDLRRLFARRFEVAFRDAAQRLAALLEPDVVLDEEARQAAPARFVCVRLRYLRQPKPGNLSSNTCMSLLPGGTSNFETKPSLNSMLALPVAERRARYRAFNVAQIIRGEGSKKSLQISGFFTLCNLVPTHAQWLATENASGWFLSGAVAAIEARPHGWRDSTPAFSLCC